jgi:hypothetical protein
MDKFRNAYRPLSSDWSKIEIGHGISTTRSTPSKFIKDLEEFSDTRKDFWRDVADRDSMTDRVNAYLEPKSVSFNKIAYDKAIETSQPWSVVIR